MSRQHAHQSRNLILMTPEQTVKIKMTTNHDKLCLHTSTSLVPPTHTGDLWFNPTTGYYYRYVDGKWIAQGNGRILDTIIPNTTQTAESDYDRAMGVI